LVRRLGGPQSRSERGGEEKNSQPLPGLEPPIQPVVQRYTTELSRQNRKVIFFKLRIFDKRFEVFMAVKIKVEVFGL
jgi:hypothetical protein